VEDGIDGKKGRLGGVQYGGLGVKGLSSSESRSIAEGPREVRRTLGLLEMDSKKNLMGTRLVTEQDGETCPPVRYA